MRTVNNSSAFLLLLKQCLMFDSSLLCWRKNLHDRNIYDARCFSALLQLERFSYDLEMKTRKQNRNDKRTEIERFDWFIEGTDKRVWLFIG